MVEDLRACENLWMRISTDDKPTVAQMHKLLEDLGFKLVTRVSGAVCIQTLHSQRQEIENALSRSKQEETKQQEEEEEVEVAVEQPVFVDGLFEPASQCECSLLSEAQERFQSCLQTSFRTNNGEIMLENDLAMFEDVAEENVLEWVKEMRERWSSRLHSNVFHDFEEALDLWVLAQTHQRFPVS